MTTAIQMDTETYDDAEYDAFLARVQARFRANATEPLFATDAEGLFDAYLDGLPASQRQHHTCNACRRFFEQFGAIVTIDEAGRTTPAIWNADDAPGYYRAAVERVVKLVRRAKVVGVFLSSAPEWGSRTTPLSTKWGREWNHLAVTPPPSLVFRGSLVTAFQKAAEKREEHHMVARALAEYPKALVEQALTILRSDTLYRSEKVIGPAEWLAKLHVAREAVAGPARDNVLWRAIATAPAGFCHPRASMVGTLLDDLAAGMAFDDVGRRFASKMHPLQYQRPQAAPTAGAIAQAEKIVAELNAAGALARRFARLDEVEAIWKPTPPKEPASGGVFGHIAAKGTTPARALTLPAATMTWEKFRREVLPNAMGIEFYARAARDSYTALVTAVNPDAPPILQWDRAERRNPVSWYFWNGGSTPSEFSLQAHIWTKVTAVALNPSSWGDTPLAHHGAFALFVLDGARDTRMSGNALFPEILRSEFHAIRSVIEAYSRAAKIEGGEQASACGIALQKGSSWNQRFRVTTSDGTREYVLDRWD